MKTVILDENVSLDVVDHIRKFGYKVVTTDEEVKLIEDFLTHYNLKEIYGKLAIVSKQEVRFRY